MKVTARAGGVPTAHWSANYTPHTVVPPYAAFYDRLACTMCLCPVAFSCSRCDVVNPTLQIRCIGHRSAVALSCPMRPVTADALVSDVRHQHRSDTTYLVVNCVSLRTFWTLLVSANFIEVGLCSMHCAVFKQFSLNFGYITLNDLQTVRWRHSGGSLLTLISPGNGNWNSLCVFMHKYN